ncbi:MAG: hypothetical protein JO199_08620 [Candidatus Eremiobacteraeota bacterium]|nr:hypothetical protein [Candidatus Eremiobacteraeota bacterium]
MIVSVLVLLPYGVAVALFAFEAFGLLSRRPARSPAAHPVQWVGILVATYALQLGAIWYAATHGAAYPPWRAQMPLPVMDLHPDRASRIEALMLACGGLQSFALIALYRSNVKPLLIAAGTAMLAAMSLAAPALASADAYSNAGYSMLANPYITPVHGFGGAYAFVDRWWGVPMVPSPYGPLWTLLDRVAIGWAPSLLAKMIALRVLCAVALGATVAALWRLGMPLRIVAIAALNPALFLQFVANAHNDVVALLVIALAALAIRRNVWLAALALVAAGLLKVPYALLGLPVLAAVRNLWRRSTVAGTVLVATAALSWWAGGPLYAAALATHARMAPHEFVTWRVLAALVAIAVLVAALAGVRRLRTAVWLVPPLGALYPAFLYPWYLMWSFPYALARRRVLAYLLVWLPFASALVNQHLLQVWTLILVYPLVALFAFQARSFRRSLR